MTFGNHRPGLALALMGLAATLLAVPATASADHADRRARSVAGHRGDDVGVHRGHRHDRFVRCDQRDHVWAQRRARGFVAPRQLRRQELRHAAIHRHKAPFYCEPCRHRFTERDRFHRHLRHHHHVAPWRLSFAIVHHAFGWVFYG